MLKVTQPGRVELPIPQWGRGLDLRKFAELMVTSVSPLENISGDKRLVGTRQGYPRTLEA